jgi:4-amino-4-deoxy-L-arabinose transferase-like glycosyltransferase
VSALTILTIATLACLVPFLHKAFHIDDPLFIWSARHIQGNPINFYGFQVNWDGWLKPMAAVTQNPPLAAYYMALAGSVLGWSEIALHAAFLLPALGLIAGTYFLARKLCSHPLAAALITVAAPVFLLSSTSVMCDVTMLALWVWSVVCWMEGLTENRPLKLCVAAVLISACCLTKYFGISLLPLLLVYSLLERKRISAGLFALAIPVLVLGGYQWLTYHLYGKGLLFNAVDYAAHARVGGELSIKLVTGLAFTGGSILILLPLAPWLWNKKSIVCGFISVVWVGLWVAIFRKIGTFSLIQEGHIQWFYITQFALMVTAGGSLLVLSIQDWRAQKTPVSALLVLWVAGTYLFAAAINWTVSGRNILPMLPAAAILIVRRMEFRKKLADLETIGPLWMPLGVSVAVGLLATWADYQWANSARIAAVELPQKIGGVANGIWFEGHWGFQYYIEQQGGKALDRGHLIVQPNAAIIFPLQNSYRFALPANLIEVVFKYDRESMQGLTTMSAASGAGFYSDGWGPLPYVFCNVPPQQYVVLRVK